MSLLFKTYLMKLKKYAGLQKALHNALEESIILIPLKELSFDFSPTQHTILEQIKHWPDGEFNLPPAAWVQPREGKINLHERTWKFLFHGSGLSFLDSQTQHDISIEYTQTGELGVTEWTAQLYFKTLLTDQDKVQDLLVEHKKWFEQAVNYGYLLKASPLFGEGQADQTYMFSSQIDEPIEVS
ncbi:MAG: hypothetical protein GY796_25535 [Chloroflexi bacterium]|nr:hypothetical protein [Chloroflexota bacterium]